MTQIDERQSVLNKVLGTSLNSALGGAVLSTDKLSQAISRLANTTFDNKTRLYAFSDMTTLTSDTRDFIYTSGSSGNVTLLNSALATGKFVTTGAVLLATGAVPLSTAFSAVGSTLTKVVETTQNEIASYTFNYKASMATTTFNNVSNNFESTLGLMQTVGNGASNNGIFIRHNGIISPNYHCVCIAGGVQTVVFTTIPVVVSSTITPKFTINISTVLGVKTCKFYIDGVLMASITSNIPTNVLLSNACLIRKALSAAGNTTSAGMVVDYMEVDLRLTR